jgi:hypothetical protein
LAFAAIPIALTFAAAGSFHHAAAGQDVYEPSELTANPDPIVVGEPVTFTVVICSFGDREDVTLGTVTFYIDGMEPSAAQPMVASPEDGPGCGKATWTTTLTEEGVYGVAARYDGPSSSDWVGEDFFVTTGAGDLTPTLVA